MASEYLDKSGLTYLWGKLKDKFAPKVHTHAFDQITPIASKTFTGVIGTANNWANATFFFGTVMPTDFYALWSIKYRVKAVAAGETSARAMYDICIIGNRNTYSAYSCWNAIENTSYYPIYYHVLYRAKSAGISAGYGHALGERIYSSWNATTVANARTINVDVYECVNCTFTFFDSMLKYAEIPGTGSTNYYTYTEFNATGQGLQESGDANTTDDPISYPGAKSGSVGVWGTSISMLNANGLLENICTASDGTVTSGNRTTAKTKIANTHGFQVGGKIYYNGSTYAANTNLGNLYNSSALFDSRYSFNTELVANSLTPYQMVYLVGTIHNDGLFYLDTVWWTQTPTDTSKVYILVGGCYDSTTSNCRISLYQHNPWFTYNGSYLVQLDAKIWTAYQKPSDGIPKTDLATTVQTSLGKADTAYQKPSGGIPGSDLATEYAPIASPTLTGTPKAPTASSGNNSTQIATTAFVKTVVGDYVKNKEKLLTTDPFLESGTGDKGKKLYISKIDNAFYCANKRWTVTATNDGVSVSEANVGKLFDGDYDSYCWAIPAGKTSVITINFNTESNGCFPGYPYGDLLASFYYIDKPQSITGRVYVNYEPHGIGWHDISFSNLFGSTFSGHNGWYQISQMEITIVGNSSAATKICELEFALDRPGVVNGSPFVDKYSPQTLYHPITAPNFIGGLTGNASTATKLAASKTIQTNLASTSSASFDGSANVTPGVTGTLGIGNGGTGATNANNALANLGGYAKPSGGIPATDLASGVQTNLGLAATAYQKPSGGIPSTDLAESYYLASNPSGYTSNTGTITGVSANGTSVATSGVANIPAASTSAYGVTKLSDSTSTTSSVLAATPTAVKAAYDLANGKYSKPSGGIPATDLAESYIKTSEKGAASGVASLTSSTKVTARQITAPVATEISAATTLTADHIGHALRVSAAVTITLPTLVDGDEVEIWNTGSGNVTLSGTIFLAGTGNVTSCVIEAYQVAGCKQMDNRWYVSGGVSA